MQFTIKDKRHKQTPALGIDETLVGIYAEMAGVDLDDDVEVRIYFTDHGMSTPYGDTTPRPYGYRVRINVQYGKVEFSESARYVLSNTVLHELRHVAQMQANGGTISRHQYNQWAEAEAQDYGRKIKGQPNLYAVGAVA